MKKYLFASCLIIFSLTKIYSQDTLLLKADYIPQTDTSLVFIPSDYDSSKTYPLVFMLHGYSGNYSQWSDDANLPAYANKYQFIIVCPDGFFDSWYINSPVKSNSQWETFFFYNLVPAVFKNYRIDYSNIFITGLSMGGYGAIYLMLKNPGFFKSAGSTSGILDITQFPDSWGLDKVLGNMADNKQEWISHSDFYLIKNLFRTNKKIIIDCGTDDFAYEVNKRFVDLCKEYGINVTFNFGPGNHSHAYWKKSIPSHFEFFKKLVNTQ